MNDAGEILSSVDVYDFGNKNFTQVGTLNQARFRHTATILPNGQVLVVGGEDTQGNLLDGFEIYDPTQRAFIAAKGGQMNFGGRSGHTATAA
jgi:hypothetical protein